jgi:hypothetical protein
MVNSGSRKSKQKILFLTKRASLRGSFGFTGGETMQSVSSHTIERREAAKRVIETLPVVRNFRRVIEARDMLIMNKELYQFLNLHCGFIAHYDIHGFRETYAAPRDFADVFIRHFDQNHRYFCGNYACHQEPYQDTGYSKAAIKQEFFRIVDKHKEAIGRWANGVERERRYAAYQALKSEFEGKEQKFRLDCDLCGENVDIRIEDTCQDRQARLG